MLGLTLAANEVFRSLLFNLLPVAGDLTGAGVLRPIGDASVTAPWCFARDRLVWH